MDVDALIREAGSLTKTQFAVKYPHLFFVFHEEPDTGEVQFKTEVAHKGSTLSWAGMLSVVAIVKSPNNPYADRISIGRARNCDVVLRHRSISKLHAHVRRDADGSWTLHDASSHNGTAIGGLQVASGGSSRIKNGEVVTLGALTLRVVDAESLHDALARMQHAAR